MINRGDMLELTRRMTVSRTCFTRIAGAYVDEDGFVDDTFNINFLNLSAPDKEKNLKLAKTVPFSGTNRQLKEYTIPVTAKGTDSVYQLLQGMLSCRLKNDALMDIFYEQIADGFPADYEYAVYVFAGTYDVPAKTSDGQRLEDSETVYNFLICTISPLCGEYEPDKPVFGFLYPAFSDRCGDPDRIDIYHEDEDQTQEGLMYKLLGRVPSDREYTD